MAFWGRLKSLAGGNMPIRSMASAATVNIPDEDNAFVLTGTTTITSLLGASYIRNRRVTFIGGASAAVTFTNTNTPSTVGQMYLQGADRLLEEDDVIVLILKANGYWTLENFTG